MSRNLVQWARQQAGEDGEPKAAMRLNELAHKLFRDAPSLMTKHHSAGSHAHMHWRVLQELVLRCVEEGGTENQRL